jgi:maleate isomerase
METEIPAMLRAREGIAPERFTFHSARMRMQHVTKESWRRWTATPTAAPWSCRTPRWT